MSSYWLLSATCACMYIHVSQFASLSSFCLYRYKWGPSFFFPKSGTSSYFTRFLLPVTTCCCNYKSQTACGLIMYTMWQEDKEKETQFPRAERERERETRREASLGLHSTVKFQSQHMLLLGDRLWMFWEEPGPENENSAYSATACFQV